MIELVSLLSRKYMNKDLVLTDEKKLRLKDALAKMTGDVWVNSETGTLMKLTISGNFDDEMFDMHVKGPMALSFDFSDFNKAVTTSAPTPVLTLEELQIANPRAMNKSWPESLKFFGAVPGLDSVVLRKWAAFKIS